MKQLETERKYDVDESAAFPDVSGIPGVARAEDPVLDRLVAVYFDTQDLDLAARGMTLRRRTGGPDAGWHLKIPAGADQREEIHEPLGQPDRVPDVLKDLVIAYTRGRTLSKVALLATDRTTHRLHAEDGSHLADLADDKVRAETFIGPAHTVSWREWEIEAAPGADTILDAAAEVLVAAGATPSAHPAKLARALGDAWPGRQPPRPGKLRKKGPVSDVPTTYLGEQLQALLLLDYGVRTEEPDAVHQMRSATRRSRSVLATYRKLFDKAPVNQLERELKWLARHLGRTRDAEVLRERLIDDARGLEGAEGAGHLPAPVDHELDTAYNTGYQRLIQAIASGRYFRLLDDLESFRDRPPARPAGSRPARKGTIKAVNKAAKRLDRSRKTADGIRPGTEHDLALHQVRKDAKRLRHVAESALPIHGKRARKLAKSAQRVQQILGSHQDSFVARSFLHGIASGPGLTDTAVRTIGHLESLEARSAADSEAQYRKARRKIRGARLH